MLPQIVFKRGGSGQNAALVTIGKYKITGGGGSIGEHVLSACTSNISGAPTATNVNNAFAAAYDDLVNNLGIPPTEAWTEAQAGVAVFVAAYGMTGVDQSSAVTAIVQYIAKSFTWRGPMIPKPFGEAYENTLDLAIMVLCAQVPVSQQNALEVAIQTALNTSGFWMD